jgi:hypothetical protein
MAVVTLGDVLDSVADFERKLESFYADLRDRTTRDGTRLLTYYLARHRRHLPEALECCSGSDLAGIRRTPFKYDGPEFEPAACFEGRDLPSDVTGGELLDTAIELVSLLTSVYRWLAEQPLGEKAKSLFTSLLRIEERHLIELKKTKATDYF